MAKGQIRARLASCADRVVGFDAGSDEARVQRVMHAIMQMRKLDIVALQRASDGK